MHLLKYCVHQKQNITRPLSQKPGPSRINSKQDNTKPLPPKSGPSGINSKRQRDLPSSPQPGPSGINKTGQGVPHNDHKPYTYGMKWQRVFAKNKATDTTDQVKFNDNWKGEKLKDHNDQLHQMFDDVLDNVRGNSTDLGRVVVQCISRLTSKSDRRPLTTLGEARFGGCNGWYHESIE